MDAGVIGNGYWEDAEVVPDQFRREFRVLHETGDYVRAVELVRNDLDADIKERLSTILSEIHNDPKAQPVLKAYYNTHRFDKPTASDIERINSFSTVLAKVQPNTRPDSQPKPEPAH